jgi:hypothetical protein
MVCRGRYFVMSPILGIIDSAKSGNLYANSYESISTTVVGAGGAASIFFNSIPQTYQHLQIRFTARTNLASGSNADTLYIQAASSSAPYNSHGVYGTGSTTVSATNTGSSSALLLCTPLTSVTSGVFGMGILDIYDYKSTTKNLVIRGYGGYDNNGSGFVTLTSMYGTNSAAITQLTLGFNSSIQQFSHFALYGIKG